MKLKFLAKVFTYGFMREGLSRMIKEIHTSPYVERTNTHIVLNVIKEKSSMVDLIAKE